jgi:superfamily II DNA/RNA helicase
LIDENKVLIGDIDDLEEIVETLKEDEEVDWELGENYYEADKFEVEELKKDLENDIKVFQEMSSLVKRILPEKDDKLQKLIEILNKPPIKGKKIIIFSYFESTVKYIYKNIKDKFGKVDYIAGGEKTLTKIKRFAPKANKAEIKPDDEIQILVSTEVLAEGLNLQDGQVVINYDLHWNPVRIIQRIGRIDRIGSEHSEIYVYNFFPELRAEKELGIEERVKRRIKEIIENFGYDEKTISLDEKAVSKKLFEIFTEKPEGLEEVEETSTSKYFEFEFEELKKKYPEEYQKALELPDMVNIAKKSRDKKGIIVFCRADDYYRLKLVDNEGKIINENDWEILKLLECKIDEVGEKFNGNYLGILAKVRNEFENEANSREREKAMVVDVTKKQFEKFVEKLKRGQPNNVKQVLDRLLNLVFSKQLTYDQEKKLRAIMNEYKRKFGFKVENKIKELEEKINKLLAGTPDAIKPEIQYKYAQIIIAEELK